MTAKGVQAFDQCRGVGQAPARCQQVVLLAPRRGGVFIPLLLALVEIGPAFAVQIALSYQAGQNRHQCLLSR